MTSTRLVSSLAIVAGLAGLAAAAGCSLLPPRTGDAVVARSVKAHGGDRLTSWKTFTLRGHLDMQDGITYSAAYVVQAKAPGKLRVEQDMTADRGRRFTEYFLSDGVAWSRNNLVPGRATVEQLQTWLHQLSGIGYYASSGATFELKGDTEVEWRWQEAPKSPKYVAVEKRRAYLVVATIGKEQTELAIDKESYYLLQESRPKLRRLFHGFKDMGGIVVPTQVLEIAAGRQGEVRTPFTYDSVSLDAPIEDWLFEEDRPKTK